MRMHFLATKLPGLPNRFRDRILLLSVGAVTIETVALT